MIRSFVVIAFIAWALWRFQVLAPLGATAGPGFRLFVACAAVGLVVGLTLARDVLHNELVENDRARAHAKIDEEHDRRRH